MKVTHTLELPVSADETLLQEQYAVIDITQRTAKRSVETKPFVIETTIRLTKDAKEVKFNSTFVNEHKDHRVRVLFPTDVESDTHVAESIFETVTRPNVPGKNWENPENPQHQHAYANVHNEEGGVTVGNTGLNEYEVLADRNTIAVTMLRSTGELGDWGYFATPEAQCLGAHHATFTFEAHDAEDFVPSLNRARANQFDMIARQVIVKDNAKTVEASGSLATWTTEEFALTATKISENGENVVVRGFNLTGETKDFDMKVTNAEVCVANLLEEETGAFENKLTPAEIITLVTKGASQAV
jgi:alpha-mannosidase